MQMGEKTVMTLLIDTQTGYPIDLFWKEYDEEIIVETNRNLIKEKSFVRIVSMDVIKAINTQVNTWGEYLEKIREWRINYDRSN